MNILPVWRDGSDGCVYRLSSTCLKIKKMIGGTGQFIFINSAPKSGSTYLRNILLELTGFDRVHLVSGYKDNEQDLYFPRVVDTISKNKVVHQHTKATERNVAILSGLSTRPIVHLRNIYDCIVSLRDHFNSSKNPKMFIVHIGRDYETLNENEKLDFLVNFAAPWYINFYVSWYEEERRGELDILWTTYEELVENTNKLTKSIIEWYGLEMHDSDIGSAIRAVSEKRNRNRNRYNKGVRGRGEYMLSETQKDRISSMAKYYPKVDFGKLGL
jgi:hypothetical protein